MSTEVRLPDLGDGIESGDVLDVLVSEGDQIEKEQGILELETDKATVEVPSTHAGTVTKVHVQAGQSVGPGDALITVEAAAGAAAPAAAAAVEPPAPPPAPEPAPAQATAPPPQPAAPAAAAPAPPATPPAPAAPPTPPSPPPAQPTAASEATTGAAAVAAGPAVRRFAREVGIDLHTVTGSGPSGRITREDVLEAVRSASRTPAAATATSATATPPPAGPGQPSTDNWGPIRVERMPKIRRTIAAQMHKSWETCPRVTNFDDVDVTELERIRQASKADYAEQGIKLTQMPFVIKAVAMALRDHPVVNASVDMEKGEVIYKDYINIGIAVDTERGLVVPAMRNVDQLSIPGIARQLGGIAEKARNNDFSIDELRGGTFTISNLGAVGGTYSTPIINVPEVAILLVGRSRKMPVAMDDDQIAVRLVMPLSISYDHRLVDGAAAARFLNEVIGYLKAPSRLLLAP
jgi:pyruvate/2-oxoglutarate dehydrogenase complex dihydrolipoamide acyltransferase (E2) component